MNYEARYSTKRKIRGLKNKARRVERWRRTELTPDWARFERNGGVSGLITVGPWDFRISRRPPMWLGRQMIHGLLDIYEEWSAVVGPEVDDTFVTLEWPKLTKPKITMTSAAKRPYYDQLFRFTAEGEGFRERSFPAEFETELLERFLSQYRWQECLSGYPSPISRGGEVFLYDETRRYWIGRRVPSINLNSDPLP